MGKPTILRTAMALAPASALALALAAPRPAAAAEPTALARHLPAASALTSADGAVELRLALSRPVPWRVAAAPDPPRILLDFAEVAFAALPDPAAPVTGLRAGAAEPGWSRLVLDLEAPMEIATAFLATGATGAGGAVLHLALRPAPGAAEAARAPAPTPAPDAAGPPRRLRVALDPGHGGVDPGAEAGGLSEAPLVLAFARELRATLLRDGAFDVVLTRSDDGFVPLEARLTRARAAGADLLLSLHADALPEEAGRASGASVYTLSDDAGDRASQLLAERHERDDLLAGIDLAGAGDGIALALMDLARQDTAPRAATLADALVVALGEAAGPLHPQPRREAGFSVLKAPDFPAVLVELGFLSSAADRARLTDPAWRARTAEAIRLGLGRWAAEDAFRRSLYRR